jgi:hypothetical protein
MATVGSQYMVAAAQGPKVAQLVSAPLAADDVIGVAFFKSYGMFFVRILA